MWKVAGIFEDLDVKVSPIVTEGSAARDMLDISEQSRAMKYDDGTMLPRLRGQQLQSFDRNVTAPDRHDSLQLNQIRAAGAMTKRNRQARGKVAAKSR